MAKTYFKATFADGTTTIRGSANDYGYTMAYQTSSGVSFASTTSSIPARFKGGEIVPVEKLDAKAARAMLKAGAAGASDSKATRAARTTA